MKAVLALLLVTANIGTGIAENPPSCPEVEIGGAQTYVCLNQRLGEIANRPAAPTGVLSPSASDPAVKTGSASEAGTRERLGGNFGKSAVPQRPSPAMFGAPLH